MKRFAEIFLVFALFALKAFAQTNFSGEQLKEQLLAELRSKVGNEAEIFLPKVIENFYFPQSNVEMRFDFGEQNLVGNVFVGVEFRKNDALLRRVELPVRIKYFLKVLVAQRTINRGETITEGNARLETREVASNINLSSIVGTDAFGKIAKHYLVKGTIITADNLQDGIAIRRGDKVQVVVLSGAIKIVTTGIALDDANAGETVRVRRDKTNIVLSGIASADGYVVITK